jgi:Protein of unknown function (DUF3551)
MRRTFFISGVLAILTLGGTSASYADPYRWCAEYSGGGLGGGGTNCGFVTWEQCMATVSGIGGFCVENLFYDGIPFDGRPVSKRKSRVRS